MLVQIMSCDHVGDRRNVYMAKSSGLIEHAALWDADAGQSASVIFVNENENGEKRENNEFVNEN